jgi:hypothetical protein
MFILNNQPLSLDRGFTTEDGTQYPANWLRLSSPEERAALGITETEDEPWYDQRFYWGVGNPKDHAQLVEQWTAQVKATAGSLLSQSDWYITRASETGLQAPQSVIDRRSYIRYLSNEKEAFLSLTETTEQLAEYVTSAGFNNWESGASIDGAIPVIDNVTSGTVITGDTLFGGSGNDTLIFN